MKIFSRKGFKDNKPNITVASIKAAENLLHTCRGGGTGGERPQQSILEKVGNTGDKSTTCGTNSGAQAQREV